MASQNSHQILYTANVHNECVQNPRHKFDREIRMTTDKKIIANYT